METNLLKDLSKADQFLNQYIIPLGWKVIGAFAAWMIGSMCIKGAQKLLHAAMKRKKIDPTLMTYAHSTLGVALKLLLTVAILGIFGIETTSFSAILAAAGVAIGMAWSGLLSNFAAGVFLILFRPFKVGDSILAAGVTGKVYEIGMFATTIDTDVNVRIFVGNNKIFSDNILNYSVNTTRTILFKVQIAHGVNPSEAILLLKKTLSTVPNVLSREEITGEIAELNALGTLIILKAICATKDVPTITAQGYQAIYDALAQSKFPIPELRLTSASSTLKI